MHGKPELNIGKGVHTYCPDCGARDDQAHYKECHVTILEIIQKKRDKWTWNQKLAIAGELLKNMEE